MEPRLIDNYVCNSNIEPECSVYPLEEPNEHALNSLISLYVAQMFIVFAAFGAGSTAYEDFSPVTIIVLFVVLQVDLWLFMFPAVFILAST